MGDGELCEGSCWESVILAAHLKLGNLVVIVDQNFSNPVKFTIGDKFGAFGWHFYETLNDYPYMPRMDTGKPQAIIIHTTKGKGCKPMEDAPEMWHHRVISDEELPMLLESIHD
jgi:transketolase